MSNLGSPSKSFRISKGTRPTESYPGGTMRVRTVGIKRVKGINIGLTSGGTRTIGIV